tara:strand:- start:385 stop:675 length:291 start_codon:yes stop_codon:yes gene_type:complete
MNQKEEIRKELNEYLDKYIPRTEIDIYKHVVDFIKKDRAKQLILSGVSERLNSIDFAIHLESLTPLNRISVHPSPRTLGVDEIYDKYKRQQERNAR